MPLLNIETNCSFEDIDTGQFLKKTSEQVAELLGKPENYVMVCLSHRPAMMFAGTTDPLAYVEMKSLGLPEDHTADFSKSICALLEKHLSIPADRTYIEFTNGVRHLWGWNGSTF
jgi:phenylpyruvate tautomerase